MIPPWWLWGLLARIQQIVHDGHFEAILRQLYNCMWTDVA